MTGLNGFEISHTRVLVVVMILNVIILFKIMCKFIVENICLCIIKCFILPSHKIRAKSNTFQCVI